MSDDEIHKLTLDELLPSAHSFQLTTCGDPLCGVHIISLDRHGLPLLQTVMSPEQMLQVATTFYKILGDHIQ